MPKNSETTQQIDPAEIAELIALTEAPSRPHLGRARSPHRTVRHDGVRLAGLSYTLSHGTYDRLVQAGQSRLEDA